MDLRPKRGGSQRVFGCAWFVKEFLTGNKPYGSPAVDPAIGAPQSEIFYHYKNSLSRETAMEKATRQEENLARQGKRSINPEKIDKLYKRYLEQTPYKTTSCRYHSFVVYFSNMIRLGWVEFTGRIEHSEFQDHYVKAQPKRYYRLTPTGIAASEADWANPQAALNR